MEYCIILVRKISFSKLRELVLFLSVLFCAQVSFAQQTITGTVSADDSAIAGVTVQLKGSQTATQTDYNGKFSITANGNSTLIFTSIGYARKEVPVNNQQAINVQLQPVAQEMNAVVVIGYQTVLKKDLTGATSVINTENSSKVTGNSVVEQLQGLTPGVTVRTGGAPGENAQIEIRGVASFTDANPLYVIDGMIADANATINSDDIATIQVLKDASAAAIYGSRAANGVIIITTKKGKAGPSVVHFSAKYGIQQIPKKWDVMDAAKYLLTVQTQFGNSGAQLPSGISDQLANPTVHNDWQDEIYRTGSTQDYNLGISGGSQNGNYLISGSYFKNQGDLIANDFERASLRINTEAKKGRLTVGENLLLSNSDGNYPGGGVNAFYEAALSPPVIPVQDKSYIDPITNPGGWGFGTNAIPVYTANYLAVAALDRVHYNYAKVVGNGYIDFEIAKWLSYRFNAGLEASFDYTKEVRDTGIWRYANQMPSTSVNDDRETFTNFLIEHTLNFNKTFGDHNINGVVGYSYQQEKRTFTSGSRLNLNTINGTTYTTISSGLGVPSSGGGVSAFYRLQGYLGRINYAYKDKYLLTGSGRIDQDSRFGPNYRTGNFYSIAGSWRISNESFFKSNLVNDLKLRASYGQLGISSSLQELGGSWPILGYINNNQRAVFGVNQSPVIGESQATINNPDLRWEERNETDIGIDASFLNNRISVTADVYNNISKGVLVNVPIAFYLGADVGDYTANSLSNAASIRNKGIELSITYRDYRRPFNWDISVNGTTISNEVISVGNQGSGINYIEGTDFIRSQVGHPMAAWFMLKTDGIFQKQEDIDNYVNKEGVQIQPNAKPGDIKYIDLNGDGTINNDDRQFVGSPWPKFQGGLQFNAKYKRFSLNLQLVGVFGYKIYDDIRRNLDSYAQLNNFRNDIDPWTPTNTNTNDPRLGLVTDPGINDNNRGESDRWLENGSYLRVRNLQLAYLLPEAFVKRSGFKNSSIFVSGQNLFTITKYKGLDPDVEGAGINQRGLDNGNWPPARIISFGISAEF